MAEAADPLDELAARLDTEVAQLDRELAEIAMLDQQARAEAQRHEQRRAQAAERLLGLQARPGASPDELREPTEQALALTRRAALMEAQIDVLQGKQKSLQRFRDRLAELAEGVHGLAEQMRVGVLADQGSGEVIMPASLSRAVLSAQEDMRRDIARAMHDGPAQSLTNIVLQAQIVERLLAQGSDRAAAEVHQLTEMVQKTLEATKTFIFDVRPMVLDDLGLVPTLRRSARDRGRRAQVPIEFDSEGPDGRLSPELESAVFRILDEAINGYLEARPSRLDVRLSWTEEELGARVQATRTEETTLALPAGTAPEAVAATAEPAHGGRRGREKAGARGQGEELPPALAAMIKERRDQEEARRAAALEISLPPRTWKEIQQRAATAGITVEVSADGRVLDLTVARA